MQQVGNRKEIVENSKKKKWREKKGVTIGKQREQKIRGSQLESDNVMFVAVCCRKFSSRDILVRKR